VNDPVAAGKSKSPPETQKARLGWGTRFWGS
jgi:hypothetical protein